jgi:hypothetical protein
VLSIKVQFLSEAYFQCINLISPRLYFFESHITLPIHIIITIMYISTHVYNIYIYIHIHIWHTCSNVVRKSSWVRYTLVDTASTVTGLCSLLGACRACGIDAVFSLVHKRNAKCDCLVLASNLLSLCPSVGVEQRDYLWTGFREILYSRSLVNFFRKHPSW